MRVGDTSPWGRIESVDHIAPGIEFVSTNSHGGFHLDEAHQAAIAGLIPGFKPFAGAPWYEEDCDACIIVECFPQFFEDDEVQRAAEQIVGMATSGTIATQAKWAYVLEAIIGRIYTTAIGDMKAVRS